MKNLKEVELGSIITYAFNKRLLEPEVVDVDTFIREERLFRISYVAKNISFFTGPLFIILLTSTNLLVTSLVVSLIYLITLLLTLHYLYDWYGLYNSLIKEGFNPNEKNGYIIVTKVDNGVYVCQDGNHRITLLKLIYDKSHKIKVLVEPPYIKKPPPNFY